MFRIATPIGCGSPGFVDRRGRLRAVEAAESRTIGGTVEAVDAGWRRVILRTDSGEVQTLRLPADATGWSEVKPGDTVMATYCDNIVLRVKPATEPDVATEHAMTVFIEAIDLDAPFIAFRGPRGWSYQTKVLYGDTLQELSVGDRVDIVRTEATLVSITHRRAS